MSPLPFVRLAGIVPVFLLAVTVAAASAAFPSSPAAAAGTASKTSPWDGAVTRLVSRSTAGVQAQGASREATISARGRYVAFTSSAGNLGGLDSAGDDVFVRDRLTGRTILVSQAPQGQRPNGVSGHPSISADGRFVAFSSTASNLVRRDRNGAVDVFVRDVRRGTTWRVSVGRDAEANDLSVLPRISADGRHVVFVSEATNLVPGDTNDAFDVFVRDLRRGVTARVSLSDDDRQAVGGSVEPDISGNGRWVVFFNSTSRLGPGGTTNGAMFVRDRRRGTTHHVIQRTTDGALPNGTTGVPRISAEGRYVAFVSTATNLVVGDANGSADAFLSDLRTGRIDRASVTSAGGEVNGNSTNPAVSAFGRYVAFVSDAPNLGSLPPPARPVQEVYVHDVRRNSTHAASVDAEGIPGDSGSVRPELSLDGRHLAFESGADNLVPDDENGTVDVFVRDTVGHAGRFAGGRPLLRPDTGRRGRGSS